METKIGNYERYYNRNTRKKNNFKAGDQIYFKLDCSRKWIPGLITQCNTSFGGGIIPVAFDSKQ